MYTVHAFYRTSRVCTQSRYIYNKNDNKIMQGNLLKQVGWSSRLPRHYLLQKGLRDLYIKISLTGMHLDIHIGAFFATGYCTQHASFSKPQFYFFFFSTLSLPFFVSLETECRVVRYFNLCAVHVYLVLSSLLLLLYAQVVVVVLRTLEVPS